jgi:3,4-dihydroxy 2-butanone 4-phosphate synthase/GTP cyclohydrolase II
MSSAVISPSPFASIAEALEDIKKGGVVIVMDDEDRENEGDLIMAAEFATAEKMAFFVNYTTGILCAPLTAARASALQLPVMTRSNTDPNGTAFTVSTDALSAGTGVSAADRTLTFRALADPTQNASHFRRPGHIFPLIAKPGGVRERRGHTEASVDLCRLAGLQPVGVIGELVNKDGSMKRLGDCIPFAAKHGLKIITIEQLLAYRIATETTVTNTLAGVQESKISGVDLVAQCELPIRLQGRDLGPFTLKCFYSHHDGLHHVVLERGDITREPYDPVLVRVHSECFTGDILGSQRCDCGEQLVKSLELIAERGRGVLIYNVGHEGRGIGLANKILAYHLQQTKQMDTYAANQALGFSDDLRRYDTAVAILSALKIEKVSLITSNTTKMSAFGDLIVSTVPLEGTVNAHNSAYLDAKRKKFASPAPSPATTPTPPESLLITAKKLSGTAGLPLSPTQTNQAGVLSTAGALAPVAHGIEHGKPTGDSAATSHIKSIPINLPISKHVAAMKVGLVRTSWNEALVGPFTTAIKHNLLAAHIAPTNIVEMLVPGSFELPWAAKMLAKQCDVVICVGLLLKGETLHFEMISQSVAQGLMNLQLESGIPMINGVLNCLTEGQAEARCGAESQLSGSLAATAIHMGSLRLDQL